jgi:hypothetical protein
MAATSPQPLVTSMTLEAVRATDLHPVFISLGLRREDFRETVGGSNAGTQAPAGRVFDTALRGIGQWSDRVWFFKGGSYTALIDGAAAPEPWRPMSDWPGWPVKFSAGFDAAVQGTGKFSGWYYFFAGDEWIGYDQRRQKVGGAPQPISGTWAGVTAPFTQGVDAAIHGVTEQYDGKAWLFKGSDYIRYDMNTSRADVPPTPIAKAWGQGTWPADVDRIDFAFYGSPPNESTTIFFVRGERYVAYDLKQDRVLGEPRPLTDKWPALARFLTRPQLFLEEHYTLHRFLGQTGRGEPLDTIGLSGRAKQESKIVTKINTTRASESQRNILESTSQQAVDEVADKTNADSSSTFNQEDYAYQGKMSARGEANWSGFGGEAEVDVGFQGSTQDVRQGFADSLRNELSNSSSRTMETNKEVTSIQSVKAEIETSTETELVYTFDNSNNPDEVNFAIVQLTQEFIVLLSLSDLKLTFLNGVPDQARTEPLRNASALLADVLADSAPRDRVLVNLVDAAQGIVDVNGQPRDLVTRDGDSIREVKDVSTTYVPKDSVGQNLRPFVVPGIAVSVERPVILTTNTIVVRLV